MIIPHKNKQTCCRICRIWDASREEIFFVNFLLATGTRYIDSDVNLRSPNSFLQTNYFYFSVTPCFFETNKQTDENFYFCYIWEGIKANWYGRPNPEDRRTKTNLLKAIEGIRIQYQCCQKVSRSLHQIFAKNTQNFPLNLKITQNEVGPYPLIHFKPK